MITFIAPLLGRPRSWQVKRIHGSAYVEGFLSNVRAANPDREITPHPTPLPQGARGCALAGEERREKAGAKSKKFNVTNHIVGGQHIVDQHEGS